MVRYVAALLPLTLITIGVSSGCSESKPGAPVIEGVTPSSSPQGTRTNVTISGRDIFQSVRVNLGDDSPAVVEDQFFATLRLESSAIALEDVVWIDLQTVRASIPEGIEVGTYDVEIAGPQGGSNRLLAAFTICADDDGDGRCHCTDTDGDGWGQKNTEQSGCPEAGDDCDDGLASVNPGATDIADDGIDQDCNNADTTTCFVDFDMDGFGTDTMATTLADDGSCDTAQQESLLASDCDDASAATFVGAAPNDGPECMRDVDGDDFGDLAPPAGVIAGTDCDDVVASCTTDCTDADGDSLALCAGDCDDSAATGSSCTTGCATFFADTDSDTFGDAANSSVTPSCVAPLGFVADSTDCDDGVASCTTDCTNADGDGLALCAGDCDDSVATGAGCSAGCATFFADTDSDTFGDAANPSTAPTCVAPANFVANNSDCDDGAASCTTDCSDADSDSVALCAGDCDDSVATGSSCSTGCATFFADTDVDTFGDAANPSPAPSCTAPAGFVANSTDCDDGVASCTTDCTNADGDGLALCAGDCDDSVATGASCTAGCATFFADTDSDTFGDAANPAASPRCVAPLNHVANDTDCDDSDSNEFPGQTWFPDADADLFGDAFDAGNSCERLIASDVLDNTDCDDNAANANPLRSEGPFGLASCSDSVDNDCDGFADETDPSCLAQFEAPTRITELSSSSADAGPSVTEDLLELYFRSERPGGAGGADIWRSTRASTTDPWSAPSNVSELNTASSEFLPKVSLDGLTILLTSNRAGGGGILGIWVSTRASRGDLWSAPVFVPELTFGIGTLGASMDDSELRICLHGLSPVNLFESTRPTVGDLWSIPVELSELSTSSQERAGFFGPGATTIYFTSNRGGGSGSSDLYVAARATVDDAFGVPVNLSTLNSASADQDLWVAGDGSYAIFASSRTGNLELFETRVP